MRLAIGIQDEVLGNDDADRPAGPHGDGRLNIELPLDQALVGPIGGLLDALAQRPDEFALALTRERIDNVFGGGKVHAAALLAADLTDQRLDMVAPSLNGQLTFRQKVMALVDGGNPEIVPLCEDLVGDVQRRRAGRARRA
jgi:hypothetical protein